MMKIKTHYSVLFFLGMFCLLSSRAIAFNEQQFLIGNHVTSSSTVSVSQQYWFSSDSDSRDIEYEPSRVLGYRSVHWSRLSPDTGVSFEGGLRTVEDAAASARFSMLSFAATGLLRGKYFVSDDYSYGRLQPYVGASVLAHYLSAKVDFTPTMSDVISLSDFSLGFEVLAGLNVAFDKESGLFVEARFGSTNVDLEGGFLFSSESIHTTLRTHMLIVGVGWKY